MRCREPGRRGHAGGGAAPSQAPRHASGHSGVGAADRAGDPVPTAHRSVRLRPVTDRPDRQPRQPDREGRHMAAGQLRRTTPHRGLVESRGDESVVAASPLQRGHGDDASGVSEAPAATGSSPADVGRSARCRQRGLPGGLPEPVAIQPGIQPHVRCPAVSRSGGCAWPSGELSRAIDFRCSRRLVRCSATRVRALLRGLSSRRPTPRAKTLSMASGPPRPLPERAAIRSRDRGPGTCATERFRGTGPFRQGMA